MAALRVISVFSLTLAGASASSSARLAIVSPVAEASVSLPEPHEDALLQAAEGRTRHSKAGQPPAAWFGGFHVGESTYTHEGLFEDRKADPEIDVLGGWQPTVDGGEAHQAAEPTDFFVESKSGGSKAAWQSFYPALGRSVAGNEMATGEWFDNSGGELQQDYVSPSDFVSGHDKNHNVPASWFDDSVNQLDGFGRPMYPAPGSPRNFLEWEEKSVNTTMACKKPGCTANVSLLAPFDFNTEIAKNCRLSVFFHPTDFDDQYSGEAVQWVQINNKQVSANCRPFQWGCNQTAQRPLLPCVNDLPIDALMPANGGLSIAAKINEVVDECPINGNLLSGVPMVTCMVSKKPKKTEAAKPVLATVQNKTCVVKMPLQCTTRGCGSEIHIPINQSCHEFGECKLSVDVQQTDYDNKEGTEELIEYIKVDGKQVASKLKPGQNPCKSKWHGKPIKDSLKTFSALKDHALKNITNNRILIEGKITRYVDECASNGYLFDAMATVTCTPTKKTKKKGFFLQSEGTAAGIAPRHQLRGAGL